jgi:hypothetical protein
MTLSFVLIDHRRHEGRESAAVIDRCENEARCLNRG